MLKPIFIIGVPRSGTTLLRILLDSHSRVAAAPETPWILGVYGPRCSYASLIGTLIESPTGPVRNLPGCGPEVIEQAGQDFLGAVLASYLSHKKADVLVLKTPDDISVVTDLVRLFPDSKIVHIYRDGRDVALSTAEASQLGKHLRGFGRRGVKAALERWFAWESNALAVLGNRDSSLYFRLSYEALVNDPSAMLRKICVFVGIDYEPSMLQYGKFSHEYPSWEAGSTDVESLGDVTTTRAGRWRNELSEAQLVDLDQTYGAFLTSLGYVTATKEFGLAEAGYRRRQSLRLRVWAIRARCFTTSRVSGLLGRVAGLKRLGGRL